LLRAASHTLLLVVVEAVRDLLRPVNTSSTGSLNHRAALLLMISLPLISTSTAG
jgi:hypothetical protein